MCCLWGYVFFFTFESAAAWAVVWSDEQTVGTGWLELTNQKHVCANKKRIIHRGFLQHGQHILHICIPSFLCAAALATAWPSPHIKQEVKEEKGGPPSPLHRLGPFQMSRAILCMRVAALGPCLELASAPVDFGSERGCLCTHRTRTHARERPTAAHNGSAANKTQHLACPLASAEHVFPESSCWTHNRQQDPCDTLDAWTFLQRTLASVCGVDGWWEGEREKRKSDAKWMTGIRGR